LINDDIQYIHKAIDRAKLCQQEGGRPRPKVGAVLVKEGIELGSAHRGELALGEHAEFGLLERKLAHDDVTGGTLYTTLEPCTARNAPKICCSKRIVSRRLKRVVIGMLDPDQRICGRGVRYLRDHGVDVDLFPSASMATVEDQNRDFTSDQERAATLVVEAAGMKLDFAINPRFRDDLLRLDKSFKIESIAGPQTIFIIAGETIVAEVLDRHTCGLLRQEIDSRSAGAHPFRRALIVSAKTWRDSSWFTEKCPAISVGGAPANEVSKVWLEAAGVKGIKPFPLGRGSGVYMSEPRPRVVLSGTSAEATKEAVERYIAGPRGLAEFLANSWR
jgi:pyrimidine deaminase RibD-like protein